MPFSMTDYAGMTNFKKSPYESLLSNALENYQSSIKAKYMPMTAQAEAASKLAYANLMGPQFLAKLMGHEDILANLSEDQKKQALGQLYSAGSGQGTGQGALLNPQLTQLLSRGTNPNSFGISQNPDMSPHSQAGNYLGQSQNFPRLPETMNQRQQELSRTPMQMTEQLAIPPGKTFAEKAGEYAGTKAEVSELGKIRAKEISDLNETAYNAETKQNTINEIDNILSSPAFAEMKQNAGLLGGYELKYYEKFGTPEQQQLAGQFMTLSGSFVKDSARDFAGQFRKGEQALLEKMKVNPSDTLDAAIGKIKASSELNKMLIDRAYTTSQFMQQFHINKNEAAKLTDNTMNLKIRRQKIEGLLKGSNSQESKGIPNKENLGFWTRDENGKLVKANR